MNLFIKQKQTHRHRKQTAGYQRGRGAANSGVWASQIHSTIYKTEKQQGPAVQHRELCSILCNNLKSKIT